MSTSSGSAAKGEKGKGKFQSLNINSIYTKFRGESSETQLQKSTSNLRRNGGMTTLGKVVTRRCPANLPSLKSEHSGNDPTISLVPSGGTGWVTKPGETTPSQSATVTTPTTTAPAPIITTTSVATTTISTVASTTTTHTPFVPQTSHVDKSWSGVISNSTEPTNFLAHQSPLFHQEFPSLSGAESVVTTSLTKTETQYGSGPSLRPQTEGSWMQGGSKPQGQMGAAAGSPQGTVPAQGPLALSHLPPGLDVGGVRNNLGQSGVGVAQGGPVPLTHMPPQLRGVMPPFMLRGNFPGNFPPNFQNSLHGLSRPRYPSDGRFVQLPHTQLSGNSNTEPEENVPRPIVKEEDLNRMDVIARDVGWANNDDIDYNQKLDFSDKEDGQDDKTTQGKKSRSTVAQVQIRDADKRQDRDAESIEREERSSRENLRDKSFSSAAESSRGWQQPRPDFRGPSPMGFPSQIRPQPHNHSTSNRSVEDEDMWREKQRISKEVEMAKEKAKQRKEEEEKRFAESKQAANTKLKQLEEKMSRRSTSGEKDDLSMSQSSSANITPSVNIPFPDWEKDKEKDRSQTSGEGKDEKSATIPTAGEKFRQMAQLERSSFTRDGERERDRQIRGERETQSGGQTAFSRQFQSNLPPRFQKQQAERPPTSYYRQGSGGSPQPPASGYETRWQNQNNHFPGAASGNVKGRRNRTDSDMSDRDREDDRIIKDRERRDRNTLDNYDRDRYNNRGRDRNFDSSWKSSGAYHDGSNYSRGYQEYDNRGRERESVESEERRDSKEHESWDKENRFLDDHRESDKKFNEGFTKPRTPVQEDPFDKKDNVRDNRHERERDIVGMDRRERDQHQRYESRDSKPDRPQRPDSRDSRTSRESRNSRDSMRDESKYIQDLMSEREFSWADSPFEPEFKEEKPRGKNFREDMRRDMPHQSFHQRHIPGPITREKLEAADRSEPQRLVPLTKSDKKPDIKKFETQKDTVESKSETVESLQQPSLPPPIAATTSHQMLPTEPESWADAVDESVSTPQSPLPNSDKPVISETDRANGPEEVERSEPSKQSETAEEHLTAKCDHEENISHKEDSHRERDKSSTRGGKGLRHDPRSSNRQNWNGTFAVYQRGTWNSRGSDSRGRRGSTRGSHRTNTNQDWRRSESEVSGDEISASTESGKEEKDRRIDKERKTAPRSPKQGARKFDKENRNRETRRNDGEKTYSGGDNRRFEKRSNFDNNKVGNNGREGFAPRGEPSRRGRGGFKTRGSVSNVGRLVDGYGPPSSKSPFTTQQSSAIDDKKSEESEKLPDQKEETNLKISSLVTDDPVKINQQLLSAGITTREEFVSYSGNHSNFKKFSSFPPRMQQKNENERRERHSGKGKDDTRKSSRSAMNKGMSDAGDEAWETTSENSEHEDKPQDDGRPRIYPSNRVGGPRKNSNVRYNSRDKQNNSSYDRDHDRSNSYNQQSYMNGRAPAMSNKFGSNGSGVKEQLSGGQVESNASSQGLDKKSTKSEKDKNNLDHIDLSNFASVVIVDDQPEVTMEEENSIFAADSGFQEVRSKKNVKEANRQMKEEPLKSRGSKDQRIKPIKPSGMQSPGPSSSPQNDQPKQQVKSMFDKRPNKLPPRFAKMKETSRLQKQQHQDVADLNIVNQNVGLFPIKDLLSNPAPPPAVNAWERPITTLSPPMLTTRDRPTHSPPVLGANTMQVTSLGGAVENCGIEMNEHTQSGASSQRSSPSAEKALRETMEKAVLDGTSPPVKTIIFENTNLKSSPTDLAIKANFNNHLKNQRMEKGRERKMEDDTHAVGLGFKPPGTEVKDNRQEPIQMPISFAKNEDNADMKLDFSFDTELSQLTDEKNNKTIGISRSMHMVQSSAADLNFKIASVKKVWEKETTVLEHHPEDGNNVSTSSSFTPSFSNTVEDTGHYVKAGVSVVDTTGVVQVDGSTDVVYNNGPHLQNSANNYAVPGPNMIKSDPASSNVCKVKPQPQMSGGLGEHVHASPLSPPPGTQPSGHLNFQPQATPYSNISVSSPPAMLFNSSQQLPTQGDFYPFQSVPNCLLGGQGRSQISQFTHYGLSQNLTQTSAFNQQSTVYLPAAPPPNGAPPDLFQSQISGYRLQPPPTYGTSQQINSNPNQVLISSNSNSLISGSVKPSNQQIGAIGSKGAYPPSQHSQLYIPYDPNSILNVNQNFLSNSQLVPQRPTNVPPPLAASSSFYSTGTGAQTAYFPAASSTLQAAQAAQPLHQTTAFGMQGYTAQSSATTPVGVGMQSFGSHFLSNPLQMAQQYRTTPPSYLKSSGAEPSKSPQQDISVFTSVSSISSPKSRATSAPNNGGGGKPTGNGPSQQQPSPTQGHHKFSSYQNAAQANQLVIQQQQQQVGINRRSTHVNLQAQAPSYPSPIQRPVAFQQPVPGSNTNMMPGRHRVQSRAPAHAINKIPSSAANTQYYSSQNTAVKLDNNGMDSKIETVNPTSKDKITDSPAANKSSSAAEPSAEDNTSTND